MKDRVVNHHKAALDLEALLVVVGVSAGVVIMVLVIIALRRRWMHPFFG